MIKAKPPRPSKPSKLGDGGGDGGAASDKSKAAGGGGAGGGGSSASKKRRPSQKKKDVADAGDESNRRRVSHSIHTPAALHQEEHRRYYQRAPRLLPEIDGVHSLSSSEIQTDLKQLQSALVAFESKMAGLLPPGATNPLSAGGGVYLHGNKANASLTMEDAYEFMVQKRRARPNGVITPEEVVESLPLCRRAVRITQRELAAMKHERDDLERNFMRHRCKLLWQLGEMKRIQKQQDKVLRVLGHDVIVKAKSLASSRRRTNALQDIMTELDARGSTLVRLTREKHQLETLLAKHGLELPEPEEIYMGDRVQSPFGQGCVVAMDDFTRVVTIQLENGAEGGGSGGGRGGATAYVQEDSVELLPSEISYLETEKELKQTLFDKIGALVQLNSKGKFSLVASGGGAAGGGGGSSSRRRSRAEMADDSDMDADTLEDEDDEEDDEDEDDEDDGDQDETDEPKEAARRRGESVGGDERPNKKRKLMVLPSSSSSSTATKKKSSKNGKVFDFTAGKIPITPYDSGLLLSPLSVLPERVAAVGPDALQWMSSYLPAKMAEWEQERYESLQMQGEIERLKFQLRQAETEKEDAQALAVEQVDSMNELVRQMEKMREQLHSTKDKDPSSGDASSSTSGSSHKKQPSKSNGKSHSKSSSNRRQRSDSVGSASAAIATGDQEEDDDQDDAVDCQQDQHPGKPRSEDAANDAVAPEGQNGSTHDDEDDDDGESSDPSKPATVARSLRPRRAATTTTATSAGITQP